MLQSTFRGYEAMSTHYFDARWFLKVDDDTIVHVRNFWRALMQLDRTLRINATDVDPSDRLHMVGDCARFCGGSALLLSRATVVGLANVSAGCIRWELAQLHARIGSDTAVTNCFLRVLGGRGGRLNHEGFYAWAPQRVNTSDGGASSRAVSSLGSIGACNASRLGSFYVADGWIAYHHVVPEMMTEMHAALERQETEEHGKSAFELSEAQPQLRDRVRDSPSCAGVLPIEWTSGGAIHRCVGVLCWMPVA